MYDLEETVEKLRKRYPCVNWYLDKFENGGVIKAHFEEGVDGDWGFRFDWKHEGKYYVHREFHIKTTPEYTDHYPRSGYTDKDPYDYIVDSIERFFVRKGC